MARAGLHGGHSPGLEERLKCWDHAIPVFKDNMNCVGKFPVLNTSLGRPCLI